MIEALTLPVGDADLDALARLLAEAVAANEAVSFLSPLTLEESAAWWRKTLDSAHDKAVFLVSRDAGEIVGSVQLHPAWAPNQPHRAEVCKLLVAPRCRGKGLGETLMVAVEDAAREAGFSLLTLDAKRGEAAERLYRRLGWTHAGTIPAFAYDPDGETPHDALIFYKNLNRRSD